MEMSQSKWLWDGSELDSQVSVDVTELMDSFSGTLVSIFPPFSHTVYGFHFPTDLSSAPKINHQVPANEGALIKVGEKSLTLFPLAACRTSPQCTALSSQPPAAVPGPGSAAASLEWSLGKGERGPRGEPERRPARALSQLLPQPLLSVLPRVPQGSHTQAAASELPRAQASAPQLLFTLPGK